MPELIAIAFGDLHIHKFRNFNANNQRLSNSLKVLKVISNVAIEKKVRVLFTGDLYHNPKELENEVNSKTLDMYRRVFEDKGIDFYAISGNHDMSEKNGGGHISPSHLDAFNHFKTFHKADYTYWVNPKFTVWGLPYMNSDLHLKSMIEQLKKDVVNHKGFKILLLHSDCPGATTPEGIEVKETEHIPWNLDVFFKEFDLVLFGHIHKPQQLSKKCYMLGSPIHQNAGDEGCEMGYWEVYSDASMKFVPLNKFPKFVRLGKGEEVPDDKNYYIPFEDVLEDEDAELGEFNLSNTRKQLAKRYCKIKGVKGKAKRRALIEILNQAE